MTQAISHITFIVKDLEKSSAMLKQIFNAKEVYSSEEDTFSISKEKFFTIKDLWIALMEGEPLKEKTYNHIAFKALPEEMEEYESKVKELGLETRERKRVQGEADSLYFYDYDNHLFEIHTGDLETRLNKYKQSKN